MALTKKRIGEIDRETVRLHCVRKHIACPFHIKGRIMRRLMHATEGIPRDLVEGVRLYPEDSGTHTSVLLNPDRTRPVFHIAAESENPAVAQRFADEYETQLLQWIKNE